MFRWTISTYIRYSSDDWQLTSLKFHTSRIQLAYFLFAFKLINYGFPSLPGSNPGIQRVTSAMSTSWEGMSQMLCWTKWCNDWMTTSCGLFLSPFLFPIWHIAEEKAGVLCMCMMCHACISSSHTHIDSVMHSSHPASSIDPSFKPITAKSKVLRTQTPPYAALASSQETI